MRSTPLDTATRLARYALGALFLWTAAEKLVDPERFVAALAAYQLVPAGLLDAAAALVMLGELAVGGALLLGRRPRAAGMAAVVLLGLFAVAIGSAMARGLEVDCGCLAAVAAPRAGWAALARNAALAALALFVARPVRRDDAMLIHSWRR